MKEEALLALIDHLYDTALEPTCWASFAPVLARSFGAESAVVQIQDRPRGVIQRLSTTVNYTPDVNRIYRTHFYKHDLWVAAMLRRPRLAAALGQELVPDDVFFRSVHYNEFCKTLGIACVIGSVFPLSGDTIGIIGIHRSNGVPTFDSRDKRMMDLFLPHLRRALQMYMKLADARLARQVTAETLSTLETGVAVLDARCRIIFLNTAAEKLLQDVAGVAITAGAIWLRDPGLRGRLERMIALAAGAARGMDDGGVLTLPRRDGQPLSLLVCPLSIRQDGLGPAEPLALVFVSDSDRGRGTQTPEYALRQLHGLTSAEARLLTALLAGERLQGYAERNAVTVNTVRNQLAHIFSKTGTSRQAELVRSCLSNPVLRMAANRGAHAV